MIVARPWAWVLAISVVATAVAPPAAAWTHRGAKWRRSDMPVPYYINQDLARNLADTAVVTALRSGFEAWAEPECGWAESRFLGRTDNFDFGRDDDHNVVSWRFNQWTESETAIAVTSTITGFSQEIRDSDMIFNDVNFDFDTRGARNRMDIAAVGTHEAGHFFGLGHTDDRQATMFPTTGPGNTNPRTIDEDDIEGICDLYALATRPGVSMGEPCGEGCEGTLICLSDETAQGVPYCTHDCDFRDDCPEGFFCVQGESTNLCRRYAEGDEPGADLGDACSSPETGGACQIGLFCVQDGDASYCTGQCDDFSNPLVSAECPPGWACQQRRGGVYACLVGDDEAAVADPPPDLPDDEAPDDGEPESETEDGVDDAEADMGVDNSLCATPPATAGGLPVWGLLVARR